MWAVIYYNDGSSSDNIYPKNGVEFGQNELAMSSREVKRRNITAVMVYGI